MLADYAEHHLLSFHHASSSMQLKDRLIIFGIAFAFLVFVPWLHIGVFYCLIWAPDKPTIARNSCSCSCFDTVFRGRYEYPPSGYKHVYFNATWNVLQIWFITVTFVILAYEAVRYMFLLYRQRRLHTPMFILFLSSIYPHYYAWWSFFSYLNEDFYQHWHHDILFVFSEIISTAMVLHLADLRSKASPGKFLFIIDISLVHICVAGLDQFIEHVLQRQGFAFQVTRDLGLMVPDLLHVIVPLWELRDIAVHKRVRMWNLFYKEELFASFIAIILFSLYANIL